ncbi:hypothetical protein AOQ84DRAFT_151178 [Glonium stellatum]|uniref:Uncharacterized protein n=1 Tax=Glonium stellatum TaxID=574774 RepID=A0A8E2ER84_9PEZI|nr:hypothetical protein AOQ84DRAFT_151178 [Glonium stellatum]
MRPTLALGFITLGLATAYPADVVPTEVAVLPELRALPTSGLNATSTIDESAPSSAPTLEARQNIDFDLVDSAPDPSIAPDDSANYNPTSALSSVIAEVSENPLPQRRRGIQRRDILVSTSPGYTNNVFLDSAAINAPLDCNNADTYMGAKIFTSGPFDSNLCAAACSAQSAYNLRHPPSTGKPKTCQFYNTYAMYKNGVYQGQYCSMYTESWAASYATNTGQYRGTDHYTISDSYMASNATNTGEVSCPSDIPYLSASGADFCTSYISYIPPTVLTTATSTPATAVVSSVTVIPTTVTEYSTTWATTQVTVTVTAGALKRDIQVRYQGVPTPASISTWSPSRISAACSAVATGDVTSTITQTAPTPFVTLVKTQTASFTQTIPVTKTTTTTKTVTVRYAGPLPSS